jgi:hypothetical protein
MPEVIGEAIRVCAYFRRARVSPLWFEWKGRRYQVGEIHNRWVTNEGVGRCYHFAVTADGRGDLFELCLRSETMSWYLGRIEVGG